MDSVQKVKSRLGIAEVVGSYVDLKRSGKNYKAICPFHTEDTPSFMVSPELGIYKCFGCGVSGDIFSFVQEMEGVGFYEALKKLADKAGVELEEIPKNETYKLKKRLYEINENAVKFYSHLLLKHKPGKRGLEYLKKKRGLKESIIKDFKIGYAPKTWSLLYEFLRKQGFDAKDLVKAGVVIPKRKGGGYIDKFRGRVLFPLIDTTSKIQGFMGRTIYDEGPKYLNTSDTPIFTKSNFVYGLHKARIPIKKLGAVFVEGPMDVINAFQNGIENVVAPLGTSLTQGHLKLISHYTQDVTFCFDSDDAGLNAIKRAIFIAEKLDLNVKVAMIPSKYKDLDEVLKSDPDLARDILSSSVSVYDFFIAYALTKYGSKTALGKKKIVAELSPIFSKISNKVMLDHYVKKLSKDLDISESAIYSVFSSEVALEDVANVFGSEGPNVSLKIESPLDNLESYFLFLLLKLDDTAQMLPFLEGDNGSYFVSPETGVLFSKLKDYVSSTRKKKLDIKAFVDTIDEHLRSYVEGLYLWQDWEPLIDTKILVELESVSTRLEKRFAKKSIRRLSKELSLAEMQGDMSKVKELISKIKEYSGKIR